MAEGRFCEQPLSLSAPAVEADHLGGSSGLGRGKGVLSRGRFPPTADTHGDAGLFEGGRRIVTDREAKARQIRSDAEFKASIEKQENARKAAEKEQLAQIDKMVSEQMLNQRLQKLEILLDARVKVLEGLIHARR